MVLLPDSVNGVFAQPLGLGHTSRAPVGGVGRRRVQGGVDDGLDLAVRNPGNTPGRGASFSSPGSRSARKRCRQSCTVGREMCRAPAISLLNTPSSALQIIWACGTKRSGMLRPAAHLSSTARSPGDKMMASETLTKYT